MNGVFRQIRMNKWREDARPEQVREALDALSRLPDLIPEIRSWYQAETVAEGDDDFDMVLVVDFDDEDAFNRYLENPEHLRVVRELILPIRGPSVRIRCEAP